MLILLRFFCNTTCFLYPAYASFKALQTATNDDDKQWLNYWIVIAFLSILEYWVVDLYLGNYAYFYYLKIAFVLWLQLPNFRGAEILYNKFLEPFLAAHEGNIDSALASIGLAIRSRITGLASTAFTLLVQLMQNKEAKQ